jgi:GNAT superfamily N-acetyltransferase
MDDMPMGDVPPDARPWDVARLHAVARAVADRGEHLLTVAAVHEDTGELAAFTELVVAASGDGEAEHYGTGVIRTHRGRGLARWIKTETIGLVRERFPAVRSLLADTAAENHAMRRVNASLGYEDSHRSTYYRLELTGPSPAR